MNGHDGGWRSSNERVSGRGSRDMLMLDLFSGLGGASQAMRARGWRVVTVDVEPRFRPDVVADLRAWTWDGERPDLVWASPPCDEFARESMPWCKTGRAPDLSLVMATLEIVRRAEPRFWAMENVRGAQRWIGRAAKIVGPFYLWGWFPDFDAKLIGYRNKESFSSSQDAQRAKVPDEISVALAAACEHAIARGASPADVSMPLFASPASPEPSSAEAP